MIACREASLVFQSDKHDLGAVALFVFAFADPGVHGLALKGFSEPISIIASILEQPITFGEMHSRANVPMYRWPVKQ